MIEKQKGPSIEYPPKPNEVKRFIVQSHIRGRSNHWDFRFALNDVAEGWTVNANVEGAIKIPIVTLAQLKALHEDQKAWKVDLETGKILPRKVRTTIRGKTRIVVRPGNLFATPKAAVIPKEWMDVEGRTPFPPDWPKTVLEWWDKWPNYVRAELRKAGWDPERARAILDGKEKWEVEGVPVGATRAFPGVFYKFEDGLYTLGCFPPDQKVFTSVGWKPIKDIREGDMLLRADGRGFQKVLSVFERDCDEGLIEIKASAVPPIRATPDHLFLAYQPAGPRWRERYAGINEETGKPRYVSNKDFKPQLAWVPAKELRPGDFLAVPRPKRLREAFPLDMPGLYQGPLTPDHAWLIGLFLADGSIALTPGQVTFYLNPKTDQEAIGKLKDILLNLGVKKVATSKRPGCLAIRVTSAPLVNFLLENCFTEEGEKRVPLELLFLSADVALGLLRGLYAGDGRRMSSVQHGLAKTADFGNTSWDLIYPAQLILARFGYLGTWNAYKQTKQSRRLCQTLLWSSRFFNPEDPSSIPDPKRLSRFSQVLLDQTEGFVLTRIKRVKKEAYHGKVYDLETEDHTIPVGVVAHNSRRPWFFEYHIEQGKFFQGRLCFRLVTREKAEKSTAWQELVASRFFIVDGPGGAKIVKQVLPPAEAEEEAKLPGFWMFQTPDPPGEIHPYVLSEEAIEKKWLPPRPASALPQKFQKEAPKELRFWTIEDREKALEAREKLAEFFESGAKKSFPVVKLRKGEFKLVAQHWRGPVIIRWGPSASLYHLLIKVGSDRWLIGLDNDPRIREAVAGLSEDMDLWRELWETKERRDVEPGTDLNSTKDTPSWVELADEGPVEIMEQEAGFLKLKLGGKKLEGLWVLTEEEPGAGIWAFTREEVAPVTKALRAVLQLHSWEGGKEYDLRLERPEGWIWEFHFKEDPRKVEDQLAPGNKCYDLTWLEINEPEKRKVQGVWTRVEPLESGSVVWEEFAPDSIRFALTGMGALSGTWTASLREGGWLIEKLVEKSLPLEIVRKDAKKRVVTGIVLEPGTKDAQGDIIPAEEIEKAAWDFLARWRYTGLHHEGEPDPRLQVVESWIAPVEFSFPENKKFVVRKGTWLLSVRCPPDIWEKVEKGELRGFSIQGMGKRKRLSRERS